jgi:hypothetical protein
MSLPRALKRLAPSVLLLMGMTTDGGGPRYSANGALMSPSDYREWVFLSSGLDMSYTEDTNMMGHSMFDNVFVDAASWVIFKRTGHWPNKSIFVMENRGSGSKGSINKQGYFQTQDLMGVEFHVHDETRFKGGWGFFAGSGTGPAAFLPVSAPCYSCHETHGAVDTTFTQFYPTAKPIAVAAGSYREQ